MKKCVFSLAIILLFACASGLAQSNEIGATIGGQFVSGSYGFGHSGVFIVNPAHRLLNAELAELYLEVPLTWTFENSRDLPLLNAHQNYSSFYAVPGLKLKVLPQLPISPYGFAGVGLAHFRDTNTGSTSNNTAFDYGAGLDWKLAPFISLRGELRDINSGVPGLGFPIIGNRQQNVMATVGVALHF